jgi:hypothetical protein
VSKCHHAFNATFAGFKRGVNKIVVTGAQLAVVVQIDLGRRFVGVIRSAGVENAFQNFVVPLALQFWKGFPNVLFSISLPLNSMA